MNDATNRLSLALSANENYAFPLLVTLYSALKRASSPFSIVIADGGLSEATKGCINALTSRYAGEEPTYIVRESLRSYTVDVSSRHGSASIARLELPRIIAGSTDTLIYLDCDTLVLGDVTAIEVSPSHAISAARDMGTPCFGRLGHLQRFGIDANTPYFNAGVLGIDVEQWLREEIESHAFELYTSSPSSFPYADQDVLNILTKGNWNRIDTKWNVQLDAHWSHPDASMDPFPTDPAILHFTSRRKPWHACRPRKERMLWIAEACAMMRDGYGLTFRNMKWFSRQYSGAALERVRSSLRG